MRKISKDDILTGFYTKGGEFAFESGEDYIGPYFVFRNRRFSGAHPKDKKNRVDFILPYPRVQNYPSKKEVNPQAWWYERNQSEPFSRRVKSPRPVLSIPVTKDYDKSFYTRYFIKRLNSGEIMEIDKAQYKYFGKKTNPIKNFFDTHEVDWKITGPLRNRYDKFGSVQAHGIVDVNSATAFKAEPFMKGLQQFLMVNDMSKYYRPDYSPI